MSTPLRILVTGANGQVGHELLRALAERPSRSVPLPAEGGRQDHPLRNEGGQREALGGCAFAVIPATRSGRLDDGTPCETIDLAGFDGLTRALDRITPDVIINAAAYTAVDKAEDEPELARRINGDALGVLGGWARQHGARVVHYSTDYVFDGRAQRPYREDDATGAVSVYGRTKLAGEHALRDSGARHLVFRTAWVYAARGKNFLRTMLRLGAERDELRVVDDQVGAPTPAALIADVTVQALAQWLDDTTPARDGVYHLVASGQVSWCGFARAIFERTAARAEAHPPQSPFLRKGEGRHPLPQEGGRREAPGGCPPPPRVIAITTADYPTKATRPAFSVLDTAKLHSTFGIALPDWQGALDAVLHDPALAP